jgi:uncharacterized RDD family membrane protein YckC
MQCPACRAVYSNGLDLCPRCKTPATAAANSHALAAEPSAPTVDSATPAPPQAETREVERAAQTVSTLIEFPGSRAKPQWRKQLSERVREIQEKRAREAARETGGSAPAPVAEEVRAIETSTTPLGLVPQPAVPEMNPIVVAALRRIERARQAQSLPPVARGSRGGAAVARVAEEQYQEEINPALPTGLIAPLPQAEEVAPAKPEPPVRTLVVVPAPPPPTPQTVKEEPKIKSEPKRADDIDVDEETAERLEAEARMESTFEDTYDDRAPVVARLTSGLIDFLVVAFASSPFAAVIELTNGNWADPRVAGSMGGIVLVVMFLYLTTSTALAGRTWGMSVLSLRAVDADTGSQPTTKQSVARALLYMISLAALGLGIFYALFDAEGRTAHDLISGTAVVQE